jgi:hypothetical protein
MRGVSNTVSQSFCHSREYVDSCSNHGIVEELMESELFILNKLLRFVSS